MIEVKKVICGDDKYCNCKMHYILERGKEKMEMCEFELMPLSLEISKKVNERTKKENDSIKVDERGSDIPESGNLFTICRRNNDKTHYLIMNLNDKYRLSGLNNGESLHEADSIEELIQNFMNSEEEQMLQRVNPIMYYYFSKTEETIIDSKRKFGYKKVR